MDNISRLTGLSIANGFDLDGAVKDFNNVTWLANIQLQDLKQIPDNLKNIPKDIARNLNQIKTNFCNLYSEKENIKRQAKDLVETGLTEELDILDSNNLKNLKNNSNVLVRSQYWTIGGIVFDGVLQCEHTSESKPTDYLVQTGAIMSDHMINQPVTVSMSIIMSDVTPEALEPVNFAESNTVIEEVKQQLESSKNISNWMTFSNPLSSSNNNSFSRSVNMYKILKGIQLANYPLDITTRLYNYKNMVITGLSTVENAESFNGLVCQIQFREIMMAGVSKEVISKRALDDTKEMQAGNQQVTEVKEGRANQLLGKYPEVVEKIKKMGKAMNNGSSNNTT